MQTMTVPPTVESTHETARLLSGPMQREAVLQRVMDAVIAATGAERGFLMLRQSGSELKMAAAKDFTEADVNHPAFAPSRTVIDFVSEAGETQVIDDALTDNRTSASESVRALGLRSIVCVPLYGADEQTAGVIYLDHRGQAGRFGRSELQRLEAVVDQASVAIQNAVLYEQAQAYASRLKELQAFQDQLFGTLSTAIVRMDTRGHVISLNTAAQTLFGAGQDSAPRGFREVLGDDLSAELVNVFKAAVGGRASDSLAIEVAINGLRRTVQCAVSPLRGPDGSVAGIILLVDDRTPIVEAERARERDHAEFQRLREQFTKYVPAAVVDRIVNDPHQSKAPVVQRELSIIFADIRGFTTLSEKSTPERLLTQLNRYMTVATHAIMEHGGTLDKFMGDGVMALFNAPTDLPDHPLMAVRAAWAMQRRAAKFMEGVSFGVGVNTGQAIVGNIGTAEIHNYSCVGDTVNVASRLQGHAEGGDIVITRATYERVHEHVRVQALGGVSVKGRAEPVLAYQVLSVD